MGDVTNPEDLDEMRAVAARLITLEAEVHALRTRLDAVEAAAPAPAVGSVVVLAGEPGPPTSRPAPDPATTSAPGTDQARTDQAGTATWTDDPADPFFALNALKRRLPEDGGVVFAGSVKLSERTAADWQYGLPTQTLVEEPWQSRAETIGALGHPVRLQLLQEVILGAASVAQLTQIEGLGTSGQVYHHLRQLAAAGWVQPTARGRYDVPAVRLIPLLTMILAARR